MDASRIGRQPVRIMILVIRGTNSFKLAADEIFDPTYRYPIKIL